MSLLFFALGLMAKPMVVTLPLVLLLLDYWPLKRFQEDKNVRCVIMEKLPFFFLSALASAITFAVQRNQDAVMALSRLPLPDRINNSIVAYVRYVGKLFWPENLCVYYPYSQGLSLMVVVS